MGRQNQKKLCYSVLVKIGEQIIHSEDYISLKDISEDLNLSYQQVANLSCGRKLNKSNFKYHPLIEITKIPIIKA